MGLIAGVSTVSTSAFMVMPSGNTEIRVVEEEEELFGGETPSAVIIQMEI